MKNISFNNMWYSFLVVLSAVMLLSCSNEKRETMTQGNLTMITSEDVFPVIDLQVQGFQRAYEGVTITNLSSTTRDAVVQLLNDSVKVIVCARRFNEEEKQVIAKNELEIDSLKIAYDGIAVIVNKKNSLTKLTVDEVETILTGSVQRWSGMKGSKLTSAIVVAIGEPNTGVFEFVQSNIVHGKQTTSAIFPCSTTAEVFSLVKDRPNVVGFVSTAWLSLMPENVRELEIGDPDFKRDSTVTEMEYFAPHQAHIYRKYYPFSRTIYIYSHNAGKGVGLGFTSFAASSDGQKIIVNNGLVPATMPVRLVQLNTP